MRTLIHDSHTNGTKAVCLCGTFGHSESVSEAACSRSEWCAQPHHRILIESTNIPKPNQKLMKVEFARPILHQYIYMSHSASVQQSAFMLKCAACTISIHAQVCSNQHLCSSVQQSAFIHSFTWSIKSNSRTCQHPPSHPLVTQAVTQSVSQAVTQPVRQRQRAGGTVRQRQ